MITIRIKFAVLTTFILWCVVNKYFFCPQFNSPAAKVMMIKFYQSTISLRPKKGLVGYTLDMYGWSPLLTKIKDVNEKNTLKASISEVTSRILNKRFSVKTFNLTASDLGDHKISALKSHPSFITLSKSNRKIKNTTGFSFKVMQIKSGPSAHNPNHFQQEKVNSAQSEMPLVLLPCQTSDQLPLVFFISGDGGWTNFDQSLSKLIVENGMPVIGLNVQKYFWTKKMPQQVADDISRAINLYMKKWNRKSFVLLGYSFGASVIPFVATRMSQELLDNLWGVICLSPDISIDLEIHISDMIHVGKNTGQYDVPAELSKIKELDPILIFGSGEDPMVKQTFASAGFKTINIPGGHHFGNNYVTLAQKISGLIRQASP